MFLGDQVKTKKAILGLGSRLFYNGVDGKRSGVGVFLKEFMVKVVHYYYLACSF